MSPTSPRRTPGAERAEEFLRRVLPEPDHDPETDGVPCSPARIPGVDARIQARLRAMGQPDRESW